ncbi:hypothetical protein [Mycobacterium talmoniae]|uniref:Uncharacterized protein n=1 Tax=Mycobacterium talmoniae TaxID=1858794 RepID=A0A1S1NFX4_9MYCO|nr:MULTISPECIES: hypothetical protein [Mycobacterium]OHV01005.1 hypothetical protein BKN37_17415 [Mycobacterium talmoniae]PQM47602.1 hypothetical protein C1Y40_02190 [Mycobacterium talmoniae]TDH51273.1 hypothetical protein E2F47_16455 [Mycobacterium eburneum]
MSPDNLEARVTKLETQMHRLTERVRASERDAAAARILAGAADRDVTGFRDEIRDFRRATTASFNALRDDVTDLRGYVDTRFTQIDARFAQVDNGFIEVRGKLDAAATGQQHIVELLERLIADQG